MSIIIQKFVESVYEVSHQRIIVNAIYKDFSVTLQLLFS